MVAIVSATKVRQLFPAIVKVPKAFITAITYCFVCMCECKCVCVYFMCVCILYVFYVYFICLYLRMSTYLCRVYIFAMGRG